MGPQHIAAENTAQAMIREPLLPASMGPQHIAAENQLEAVRYLPVQRSFNGAAAHRCGKLEVLSVVSATQLASMGPQHIAAENRVLDGPLGRVHEASMGPQHIAAENHSTSASTAQAMTRASMGPQHIAAENASSKGTGPRWKDGFNGAAAHRCGKRYRGASWSRRRPGFNGAAAHRCGKLSRPRPGAQRVAYASMGPQHIAAENE